MLHDYVLDKFYKLSNIRKQSAKIKLISQREQIIQSLHITANYLNFR